MPVYCNCSYSRQCMLADRSVGPRTVVWDLTEHNLGKTTKLIPSIVGVSLLTYIDRL